MNKLSFTPAAAAGYQDVLAAAGITMAPAQTLAAAPQPAIKPAI